MPHGARLAAVIPAWLKWFYDKTKNVQMKRFAKKIFGEKDSYKGILALELRFSKIGVPVTLEKLGIDTKDIDKIVDNIIKVSPK